MSKAVSLLANDSARIRVELSGVTAMPSGKASPVRHLVQRAVGADQREGLHPEAELAEPDEADVDVIATGRSGRGV
jgi:hypothetical protein